MATSNDKVSIMTTLSVQYNIEVYVTSNENKIHIIYSDDIYLNTIFITQYIS